MKGNILVKGLAVVSALAIGVLLVGASGCSPIERDITIYKSRVVDRTQVVVRPVSVPYPVWVVHPWPAPYAWPR